MSADGAAPKKVAILGGGAGSLTVALALTEPGRGNFDVTVYQMGWRLGGKGASGRNPKYGDRIEEHGIHVWFGFYENAFKLLGSCYDALRTRGWRTPEGKPVALQKCIGATAGEGAFYPHSEYVVNEHVASDASKEAAWSKWPLRVPPNDRFPGDAGPVLPETSLAFQKLTQMISSMQEVRGPKESLPVDGLEKVEEDDEEQKFRQIIVARKGTTEHDATFNPEDYLELALDGLAAPGLDNLLGEGKFEGLGDSAGLFRLRLKFIAWSLRLARASLKPWSTGSERMRRLYLACDTFASIAVGLSRDVFKDDSVKANLDELDEIEFRDWLKTHGSDPDTVLANPTVRFVYNSAFAFRNGDPGQPRIAAGAALRGILRLFLTYKGAFAYRMASGMGDVVFSPIYETLRARGVRFKFFHRVDELEVGDEGGKPVISRIEITEQARTVGGKEYEPFVWVNDFPCWPSEPNYDQIVDGQALRDAHVNLEDPRATWSGAASEPLVLKKGEDFDEVVLGIPIGALGPISESLAKHATVGPRWREMLNKIETTPTQSFQLWFRASLRDLGWNDPPPIFGTYQDPIDTYIDMTPALRLERRRADDVKNLSYFCGVFPRKEGESHEESMDRALNNAIEHLVQRCDYIWPNLKSGTSFRWSFLWNGAEGTNDRERFTRGQYARANVLPSELYTLSLPGTTHARIAPDAARARDGTMCTNLWLTGDWTRNPISLGCVEATVMAGLQAARGLSQVPIDIIGEEDDFMWRSIGRGARKMSMGEALGPGQVPAAAAVPGASVWGDETAALRAAVVARDKVAASSRCDAIVDRSQREKSPPPLDTAAEILSVLRGQRYFDLMERVAEAFVQAGQDAPIVWLQYAQAMIEEGRVAPALLALDRIAADPRATDKERSEALGLTGRAHKQRFVNDIDAHRKGRHLTASIEAYREGYALPKDKGWHGANLVALLKRAAKDGLPAPAGLDAQQIAMDVQASIRKKPFEEVDFWDEAVLVEALLAQGKAAEAENLLRRYLAPSDVPDAFAVASMRRQFVEVWKLSKDEGPGDRLLLMLEAALLARQGGSVELKPADLNQSASILQKVLGEDKTVTLNWYRTGLERCKLVARVVGKYDSGGGTGFLVRAGDFLSKIDFADELVLLTNEHVLSSDPRDTGTLKADSAKVRFEAIPDPTEHAIRQIVWCDPKVDATLARLDPVPIDLSPYPISKDPPNTNLRPRLYVIGHPGGRSLSLSLNDNQLLDWEDPRIHYRAPTEPGSSGSPVFDPDWNLIGLHHAGSMAMPRLNGLGGSYPANEGFWIQAVIRASQRFSSSPS